MQRALSAACVDTLYKAVQRSRERHSPPIVNSAVVPWPTASPNQPGLVVEEIEYYVEEGPQGWVPLRIMRPAYEPTPRPLTPPLVNHTHADATQAAEAGAAAAATAAQAGADEAAVPAAKKLRRPVLVIMHATGENKDVVRHKQELFSRMGYFTAAIDARYHGQRAAIPYEVAAAMNAVVPTVMPLSGSAPADTATGNGSPAASAASSLVATVKKLKPQVLSALERADVTAGLVPSPGGGSRSDSGTAATAAAASGSDFLLEGSLRQVGGTRLPLQPAPAGSRTAAAEARQEAEAEARRLAYQRFVDAWLDVASEFRERRGPETTAAVLATAPPAPAPAAALSGHHRGALASLADRRTARNVYEMALMAAWRGSGERPLFLDTVWDLVLLLDVLAVREDVDMTRVGVTGFSMGGSITWLWSVIDPRIAVAAPVAGVQGFSWAIENESYAARVGRYPLVFELAACDIRGTKDAQVDAEVVRAVWDKLLPGLLQVYDAPQSLPTIATRPLLVVTGEVDASCPLHGVNQAAEAAKDKYMEWALEERARQLAEAKAAEAEAEAAEGDCAEGAVFDDMGITGDGGDGPNLSGAAAALELTICGSGDGGAGLNGGGSVESAAAEADAAVDFAAEAAAEAAVAAAVATAEEDAVLEAEQAEAAMAVAVAAARAAARAAEDAREETQRREQAAFEALLGSRFRYVVEGGVGHTETLNMRREVERWLHRHLLLPWKKACEEARRAQPPADS